jgi:hypothetical protein
MKLDRTRSICEVYGPDGFWLEQDGLRFDLAGNLVTPLPPPPPPPVEDSRVILTDRLHSALEFLKQVLRRSPLSKATVYKTAETNNQEWPEVKQAAESLNVVKFKYNGEELWKLPEDHSA